MTTLYENAVVRVKNLRPMVDEISKRARSNGIIGSLTATNPASVTTDDAFSSAHLHGITIDGHSTQDGTPTPSAPVAIKSVAECDLVTAGANVFNYEVWKGIGIVRGTAVFENNGITLTATSADAYTSHTETNHFDIPVTPGVPYTLAWEAEDASGYIYVFQGSTILATGQNGGFSGTKHLAFTPTSTDIRIRFGVNNSGATIHYQNIRVCPGTEILPYVPFTRPTATPLIPSTVEPLRSLPDGTHDTLTINRDGSGTITRIVGSTTQAVTDGVSGTVGVDVMSSTGQIANGATVLYKLATSTTETIPAIAMPSIPSQYLTAWLDAEDEGGAAITGFGYSVDYEKSLQIVIEQLSQAIADL